VVRHEKVLGVNYSDHDSIPPELWNLLVSLIHTVFKGLLKIAAKLRPEAPGHEQEAVLFVELPRVLFRIIRELASWWWSHDKGYLGAVLTCNRCQGKLQYRGDAEKKVMSMYGVIRLCRAYYVCTNTHCTVPSKKDPARLVRYSVYPLDQRLGLDRYRFLPTVQELVTWLTSMDPYGKCLQFVSKVLEFTISHRSAWLITQRIGEAVKERQDEAIANAFSNPAAPVLPQAEVQAPAVGVLMLDGTCGRIAHEEGADDDSTGEDPDAPDEKPDFREVKVALAAHLVLPPPPPRQVSGDLASILQKELTYFNNNATRIHYADYLSKGYLIVPVSSRRDPPLLIEMDPPRFRLPPLG